MESPVMMATPDSARVFLPADDVVAFQPDDQRQFQSRLLHRRDDAGGDDVAIHDAAKNVDQNSFDIAGRSK